MAVGVTVIVEIIVEFVKFVDKKEAISPLPFAANPIEAILFVQVNVVPLTGLVKLKAAVLFPLQ